MNKETISAMLSADTPAPINGEGKGGRPYFTKTDAMYCVAGMPKDAWDYMQYVDILFNEKLKPVSDKCCNKIMRRNNLNEDERDKTKLICEIALVECRLKSFSNIAKCSLIKVSERQWYRKYSSIYSMALKIYNELDNKSGLHISMKLGKLDNCQ